jgi:FkbM family methyltransferase
MPPNRLYLSGLRERRPRRTAAILARMQAAVRALENLGLHRHMQTLYQRTLNRTYWRERQGLRRLLGNFVRAGDLVFDIGANVGGYVVIFLDLGAQVVAVEANPQLAALLRRRYRVATEAVAAGASTGKAVLHLGRQSGHSTISRQWLERAPTQDRWAGETVTVPMATLDDLIARYGRPVFVKIDVEGAEADVLRGATGPLQAVSFEFQASDLSVAEECIAILEDRGTYRFAYANAGHYELERCVDGSELRERLQEIASSDSARYGDVYASLEGSTG